MMSNRIDLTIVSIAKLSELYKWLVENWDEVVHLREVLNDSVEPVDKEVVEAVIEKSDSILSHRDSVSLRTSHFYEQFQRDFTTKLEIEMVNDTYTTMLILRFGG
jgi:hypothetical protein